MATTGQTITCRAAVSWKPHHPVSIEEVTVDPPREGEVRVRMVAASLCRTDFATIKGVEIRGFYEGKYPVVPGHEGVGIVESVGPRVTSLKPGDHVLPSFGRRCRKCQLCRNSETNLCVDSNGECVLTDGTTRLKAKGKMLYQISGLGTFSEYNVFTETSLAKVRTDVALEHLSPLGCCIATGMGSALNEARVTPGSTCAVFGLGGVGLAVVLGCKLAGAGTIVGIDKNPAREDMARRMGCTDFINAQTLDKPVSQVLTERFNGGCDYTFEATGIVTVMRDAFESCRYAGGKCVVIGGAHFGEEMSLSPGDLLLGRRISGCLFGGYKFRDDLPRLVDQVVEGKIPVDDFISHKFKFEELQKAYDAMENCGTCVRCSIQF